MNCGICGAYFEDVRGLAAHHCREVIEDLRSWVRRTIAAIREDPEHTPEYLGLLEPMVMERDEKS